MRQFSTFLLYVAVISPLTSHVFTHAHHDDAFPRHAQAILDSAHDLPFTSEGSDANDHDPIPLSTRAHWMRAANAVLLTYSPCPFMAFGTVIVNHTCSLVDASCLGTEICSGVNHNNSTGNPTLDGEIAAIANCSVILTDPAGAHRLSPAEAVAAYEQLTVYTNGEPCPMCASAISWAGFREMVFGSSIDTLVAKGWPQIRIGSREVFERSWALPRRTRWVGSVLANETDAWFDWQWQSWRPCPERCERREEGAKCLPT